MTLAKNPRILYQRHPSSLIESGLTLKYDDSPTIDLEGVPLNGGFLLKTIVLSSDPYMRLRMCSPEAPDYLPPYIIGNPIENFGIGVIIRSEDKKYQPGDYLYGILTFEAYSVRRDGDTIWPWMKLQKPAELSWSLYVGVLGMPGQTAYMGWKAFAEAKAETSKVLFISGGAGPVGATVIQLAKISNPGLKVIATAGSQRKLDFMKAVGADVVINYKTEDTAAILRAHGPIDIYWDNVSGPILDNALMNMVDYGLIVACGAVSSYSGSAAIKSFGEIFKRSLSVKGFRVPELCPQYLLEFLTTFPELVVQGKIKYLEQRYQGLQAAEQAVIDVYTGANHGKAVILVSDE